MINKKTTTKKTVKKRTGTRLKVSKGEDTKSSKDEPSLNKTPPETIAVESTVPSPPNPVHLPKLRANSHSSKASKKIVVIKDKLESGKVVACLEDLLTSLKEGTLCIQHGDEFVTLSPSFTVQVEITATVKKGKQRFALELTWRSERDAKGTEFRILSSAPIDELAPV